MLADELRQLKQEQVNNKEATKTLNQFLKQEEINILKKQQDVSELENQWQILKMQQENLEVQINDVTNEVQNFLFQCAKYQNSTQSLGVSVPYRTNFHRTIRRSRRLGASPSNTRMRRSRGTWSASRRTRWRSTNPQGRTKCSRRARNTMPQRCSSG